MGLVLGALLLLGLGGTLVAATEPVALRGTFDSTEARASGDLTLTADEGAWRSEGGGFAVTLHSEFVEVEVRRVTRWWLDNPLGDDFFVNGDRSIDRWALRDARLLALESVGWTWGEPLLYTHTAGEGCVLGARLSVGPNVDPWAPFLQPVELTVGHENQSVAYHHTVGPRGFGFALGDEAASLPRLVPRSLDARGDFIVVLDHAHLRMIGAEGEFAVDAGERRLTTLEEDGAYETERTFIVLKVREGRLEVTPAPDTRTRFAGPQPRYLLEGLLRSDAAGSLRSAGGTHFVDGALELAGNFTITPSLRQRAQGALLEPAGYDTTLAIQGTADRATVNGRVFADVFERPAGQASLFAVLLAALVGGWSVLTRAFPAWVLPLYARMNPSEVLESASRRRILDVVVQRPFVHLREIQRTTGFGFGSVAYHLGVLKDQGVVRSARGVGRECFFVPPRGFTKREMEAFALLVHPARHRLAQEILANGAVSQRDLVRRLGLDQAAASRHLARMRRAGLLVPFGPSGRLHAAADLLRAWHAFRASQRSAG